MTHPRNPTLTATIEPGDALSARHGLNLEPDKLYLVTPEVPGLTSNSRWQHMAVPGYDDTYFGVCVLDVAGAAVFSLDVCFDETRRYLAQCRDHEIGIILVDRETGYARLVTAQAQSEEDKLVDFEAAKLLPENPDEYLLVAALSVESIPSVVAALRAEAELPVLDDNVHLVVVMQEEHRQVAGGRTIDEQRALLQRGIDSAAAQLFALVTSLESEPRSSREKRRRRH